jgi:hypothetical protein
MTRRELVDSMLARYGIPVWIKPENSEQTVECRAFLQPLQFKAKPISNEIGMPAGNPDKSYWLYIGSALQRLDQQFGMIIRTTGQSYLVIKAQSVSLGGEVLYIRAVLQPFVE